MSISTDEVLRLSKPHAAVLLFSVLTVSLCGITYELLIAAVSSYLLGDSVRQFSVTIGLFMAAMGLGAYLTKYMEQRLLASFILIETLAALIGGLSTVILFMVFPWSSFYEPVMYSLILSIGTLVGMEIPLLTRMLSSASGIRSSIAAVLSLDYVGALIGSIAFPLFLLPFLGLFRAAFVIGLLNAGVALFNVAVFARLIPAARRYAGLSFAVCILLLAGLAATERITAFAEGQLYTDRIIFSKQTPYQKIVLTQEDNGGEHRLYLDGHIQFAESDEYRYHEALVHPALSAAASRADVLLIGGGDGLAAREILKYEDVQRLTLVDIDPAMTEISSVLGPLTRLNHKSLHDKRLAVQHLDAFRFLQQSRQLFDCVLIDLPDPHNEALSKLYSVEFYTLLAKRLNPGALTVTQSTSPLLTKETFWTIGRTMQTVGFHVFRYKVNVPSFSGDWGFTLAKLNEPPPAIFSIPDSKTRFLSSTVMTAAAVFALDEQPQSALINTIFEPKLYLTYNREVSSW